MFQVLVDVYVDPELLVAYGMLSSFFLLVDIFCSQFGQLFSLPLMHMLI